MCGNVGNTVKVIDLKTIVVVSICYNSLHMCLVYILKH